MLRAPIEFYAGGYAEAGENGILRCAFDGERLTATVACDALKNPSWLLRHPSKPLLYAVEELAPEGRLAALAIEADGLRPLASLPTNGADPCHIAISPDARFLLVSNYSSGSLAVYALDTDGLPARMTDFRQHEMDAVRAPGFDPERQEAPHVHFSLCDGNRVYVNDLGLNRVIVYAWDGVKGRLGEALCALDFPAGSGPRHLAFNADQTRLYVLCELSCDLHVFALAADGSWRRLQRIAMVAEDFAETGLFALSTGAAIHFADARTLCASTRGHDSVTVFAVADDGTLTRRQVLPSGGRTPRDFLAVSDFLFAANQGSDCIQAFQRQGDVYVPLGAPLPAIWPTCLC